MPALAEVKAQLAGLKSFGPGLVAVFVGGTSGIGESTAREFVHHAVQPRVYLVGRSEEQATRLKGEFQSLNPESQVHFIQSDVSRLRNVDKVCDEIKAREEKVNILFMTPGYLTTAGRDETPEGLDRKLCLHYYTRLRFTQNLLPLLNRGAQPASGETKPLARVLSVLGGGHEGDINYADLSLKNNFTLRNCATHGITMNTLAFQALSKANPAVTFLHTMPGGVLTNAAREMAWPTRVAMRVGFTLLKPWMTSLEEAGQRHLWACTTDRFEKGGVHSLSQVGENNMNASVMKKLESEGAEKKVWDHTLEVFEKICSTETGKY